MGALTGRLRLSQAGCERRYDFLEGQVVFASSSHPDERLATWLAHHSVAPPHLLHRLLAYSLVHREMFTGLLLENGKVNPPLLRTAIIDLAEHITARVLRDPEAEFSFDPAYPVQDPLQLDLRLAPNQLMLEASRRHDEESERYVPAASVMLPFSGEAYEQFFWDLLAPRFEWALGPRWRRAGIAVPACAGCHGHPRAVAGHEPGADPVATISSGATRPRCGRRDPSQSPRPSAADLESAGAVVLDPFTRSRPSPVDCWAS